MPTRFLSEPTKQRFKHNPTMYAHMEHVHAEHEKHLKDGSFVWLSEEDAMILNPLQVEIRKGKKRMVADCRFPNGFMPDMQFKLESLALNVPDLIRQGYVMFTTDIEKAYYSVPLNRKAWPFACWEYKGGIIACTILMFGWATAPFVFTKDHTSDIEIRESVRSESGRNDR